MMRILVAANSEKQAQDFLRDMQKECIIDWYNPDYNSAMGRQSVIHLRDVNALGVDAYIVQNEFEDDEAIVEDFLNNIETRTKDNDNFFIYEGEAA